jgi:zinc protease
MDLLSLAFSVAVGAAHAPKIPVEQYQLDNGLTVMLSEDRALPVVSVEVLYLVGSGHERAGRTGFAHLFEHLMFQGSEHFNHEYFKPYEPIGGQVNGTTSHDRTNFFQVLPSNYLETPFWLESDRMQSLLPALTQEKLDNQREVVKNERRQRYENAPYGMAWWYLGEALYPVGHPYRHAPIGSHEDLTAASLGDVQSFFQQYYVPANAGLVVVGDFESVAVKALIQRYFGPIARGARAPRPTPEVPPPASVHWTKTDEVPLPKIYLAWHTPSLFAPGDAELDLLSSVLADGKTSRLYHPLVYQKKIAKDVEAYQTSQALSSVYVIEATAAPGTSVETLYTELVAALGSALATPPTDAELARAVSGYKKSFYGRVEAVQSRASTLGSYFLHTGRADYLEEDLKRYVQASSASVHQAAKQYLNLEKFVRLDIVPGKKDASASDAPSAASSPPPGPTPAVSEGVGGKSAAKKAAQ